MKYFLFLTLLLLILKTTCAQALKHERSTFDVALLKAKELNRPFCVLIIPPEGVAIPEGYYNIRKDGRVTSTFNRDYVSFIPAVGGSEYSSILKRYHVSRTPVLLFIDGDGQLFDKVSPNLKNPATLLGRLKLTNRKFRKKDACHGTMSGIGRVIGTRVS